MKFRTETVQLVDRDTGQATVSTLYSLNQGGSLYEVQVFDGVILYRQDSGEWHPYPLDAPHRSITEHFGLKCKNQLFVS